VLPLVWQPEIEREGERERERLGEGAEGEEKRQEKAVYPMRVSL